MSDESLVVLSTAPSDEVAEQLASFLVQEKLAACVNIVGGVRSLYWWEGAIQDDAEVLMICKTDAAHLDALTQALTTRHPYDCPEVVALPIVGGSADYLAWVGESLSD